MQLVVVTAGVSLVDRAGRRQLLIAYIWLALGVATPNFDRTASVAALALIYIFDTEFATECTPLHVLYPVEVLSYEIRAKKLAFAGIFPNMANLVNQFPWPIAIAKISWKTYKITTYTIRSWGRFASIICSNP